MVKSVLENTHVSVSSVSSQIISKCPSVMFLSKFHQLSKIYQLCVHLKSNT